MPDGSQVKVGDFLTILTNVDDPPRRMTKRLHLDGDGKIAIEDYAPGAMFFTFAKEPVADLAELAEILPMLRPYDTPIWGEYIGNSPGQDRRLTVEQNDGTAPTIRDCAHHLLPMDLEDFAAVDADGEFNPCADPARAVRLAISKLPAEFDGADAVWQLTSGAGIKPGVRLRLWFWMHEKRTAAQILRWLKPHLLESKNKKGWMPDPNRFIDGSIYSRVGQPIYGAPPVVDEGVVDPVPQRTGFITGMIGGPVIAPEIGQDESSAPDDSASECDSSSSSYPGVEGPDEVEYDSAETIAWAIDLLHKDLGENGPPAVGKGSDERAFRLVGQMRDGPRWGRSVSAKTIAKLLKEHWSPSFDQAWFDKKAANRSYRNDPGVGQAGDPSRKYGSPNDYAEFRDKANGTGENTTAGDGDEIPNDGGAQAKLDKLLQERMALFTPTAPSKAMRGPPPSFYDDERLFLRTRGGSVSMTYASYSSFKTTFSVGHALHTAKKTGCRILYAIGEGIDGFGPMTVQAAFKDWNDHHPDDLMSEEWLDAHLRIVTRVPKLLEASELDLAALIAVFKEWKPNIVFLDTLGNAVSGDDLNATEVGTAIGVRSQKLAQELCADVILVHHLGKDAKRGATGSQYLMNDPAMALELKADQSTNRLTVTVAKCRWGERGRKIVFGTRKVRGLKVYNDKGELVREDGEFVAVYELPPDEQERAKRRDQAAQEASDQMQRDLAFQLKIARALAKVTKTAADTVPSWHLAQMLDPKADFETDKEYDDRAKAYGEKLARYANPPDPKETRKTRDGISLGILHDFVVRNEMGGNFKPARFRLTDYWRQCAASEERRENQVSN